MEAFRACLRPNNSGPDLLRSRCPHLRRVYLHDLHRRKLAMEAPKAFFLLALILLSSQASLLKGLHHQGLGLLRALVHQGKVIHLDYLPDSNNPIMAELDDEIRYGD